MVVFGPIWDSGVYLEGSGALIPQYGTLGRFLSLETGSNWEFWVLAVARDRIFRDMGPPQRLVGRFRGREFPAASV